MMGMLMMGGEDRERTYGDSDKQAIVDAIQHTIDVAQNALKRAKKVNPTEKLAPAMLSNLCREVDNAADAACNIACQAEMLQYEEEGEDDKK